MPAATALPAASPASRVRATPYARRLARERNLPLSALAGSGPNGRIVGDDVHAYRVPLEAQPAASAEQVQPEPARINQPTAVPTPTVAAAPAAIAISVAFAAADTLLAQIAGVRAGITREDICLKAAASALAATALDPEGTILLLAAPNERRRLPALAGASLGAVSTIRGRTGDVGSALLSVSFLGRAGIRPVAAQLIGGADARLVIGAAGDASRADCLLSYDPGRIDDDVAAEYLAAFRDLVETPIRLLV